MSGQASAGYSSENYHLNIMGGISSWDYKGLDKKSKQLELQLDSLKHELDIIFNHKVKEFDLPVVPYSDIANVKYIDGVFIESDTDEELAKKAHFNQYYKLLNPDESVASASISVFIPDSSYKIYLSFLVSERIRRDKVELLLNEMIEVISKLFISEEQALL